MLRQQYKIGVFDFLHAKKRLVAAMIILKIYGRIKTSVNQFVKNDINNKG